jgi:hypothetical protein
VEIWGCDVPQFHFGDLWRFCSVAVLRSVELGEPVAANFRDSGTESLAREILAEFDSMGRVAAVQLPPVRICRIQQLAPTVSTRVRWCGDKTRRQFGYQFDGIAGAAEKNPPESEVIWFLAEMKQRGLEPVRLGKHLGVHGSVEAVSQCSFFIGACSGLAQVAYSVGVPAVILRYRQTKIDLKIWHGQKALGFALGLPHFVQGFLPALVRAR